MAKLITVSVLSKWHIHTFHYKFYKLENVLTSNSINDEAIFINAIMTIYILQIFQLMYWVQMNSFNIALLSCLCQRGHIFFAILQHFGTIKLFSTIGRWSLWISANLTEKRSLQNHFNVLYFRILILRKGFKHDLNVVAGSKFSESLFFKIFY